ncbi:BatD family protein [Eionea flava]
MFNALLLLNIEFLNKARVIKWMLFSLLLLLASTTHAAVLTASVDRTTITINDTLLLTVALDQQGADEIDFSALSLQFDILQRQQSSQTSIVNGRITSRTQWTLIIAPKETGQLIIPSLSANGAFSDAISIQVTDGSGNNKSGTSDSNQTNPNTQNNSQNNSQQDVFLIASTNKNSVYVQEQLLVRLQLHYRIALSQYEPSELLVDNSTQEYLDKKNYKKVINGVEYNVLELAYAVHPQASGTITIPVQRWQVEKPSARFGLLRSPYLRVTSQPITINVKPIPQASTADHWLPATSLTLSQQWQQSIISAKVGEPLSYQLKISANGLAHSQLPDIQLSTINDNEFTVYSDQSETNNQLSLAGLTGERIMNYAIIPKKTGTFTLPPITLRWWNTATDNEELITLEPQKVVVANTVLDQQQVLPSLPSTTNNTEAISTNKSTQVNYSLWIWQVITALLLLLSAVLFLLWRKALTTQYSAPLKQASVNNENKSVSKRSRRAMYEKIETAVNEQAWHSVRTLLLAWASDKAGIMIDTSDAFIDHFPELKEIIRSLDKQLYSQSAVIAWDAKQLVHTLKEQPDSSIKKTSEEALQTLY